MRIVLHKSERLIYNLHLLSLIIIILYLIFLCHAFWESVLLANNSGCSELKSMRKGHYAYLISKHIYRLKRELTLSTSSCTVHMFTILIL